MTLKGCIILPQSRNKSTCKRRIKQHNRECATRDFLQRRLCPHFEGILVEVLMEYVEIESKRRQLIKEVEDGR